MCWCNYKNETDIGKCVGYFFGYFLYNSLRSKNVFMGVWTHKTIDYMSLEINESIQINLFCHALPCGELNNLSSVRLSKTKWYIYIYISLILDTRRFTLKIKNNLDSTWKTRIVLNNRFLGSSVIRVLDTIHYSRAQFNKSKLSFDLIWIE